MDSKSEEEVSAISRGRDFVQEMRGDDKAETRMAMGSFFLTRNLRCCSVTKLCLALCDPVRALCLASLSKQNQKKCTICLFLFREGTGQDDIQRREEASEHKG